MAWITGLLFLAALFLLGCLVGIAIAAIGIGGGILMVPAFMAFIPGMDIHTAKGTSLFIIGFVAALNTWRMRRTETSPPPWMLAFWLTFGSVIAAFLAAWLTARMPDRVVLGAFFVLLVWLALQTFLLREPEFRPQSSKRRRLKALGCGMAMGAASGATGTGGGLVLIPLTLLTGLVRNEQAVLLSNMVMIGTAVAGSIAHLTAPISFPSAWTVGQVYLPLTPCIFFGTYAGAKLGDPLNRWLTLERRRVVMGVFLLLIAVQIGWSLYHGE